MKLARVVATACVVLMAVAAAASATPRLYVCATGSDKLYVIDVATNTVVQTLTVGLHPDGLAATKDGRWIWVATEGDGRIHKIDAVHNVETASFALGPAEEEMEITDDGRLLYTGRFFDGCYDVFDTTVNKVVAHIPVDGNPHNVVKAANDDRYMFLSPRSLDPAELAASKRTVRDCRGNPNPHFVPNDKIYIADTRTNAVVAAIPMGSAPRPIVVSADGRWLYANVDGLNGLEVVDVAARKVVERVKYPLVTDEEQTTFSRAHGIAITPNQKEIWSASVNHGVVYAYDRTVTPLTLVARVPVGGNTDWLDFTPDGQTGYVSLAPLDTVVAIDVATHKVVKRIALPKGSGPKTIQVVDVPAS